MSETICTTCVRCREGECDGEKGQTACGFYKRMTNFEKYFRFTTTKMAAEILCLQGCRDCPHLHNGKCNGDHNAVLDWLNAEVAE